ncbi:MAG: imidazoleglycerol-phosphate dehydratase HisB [Spirochaetota bacterium]|nr:imidazoleglycerol-phosphate dehydratase HisB [Spirochaetota bacterium]
MRIAEITRKTKETNITISLNLDGQGKADIDVPSGFFRHMLELFTFHAGFDMRLSAAGDADVDLHHTVEDTAICIGQALRKALREREGIRRYGSFVIPMDEARAAVHLDISGRPYCKTEGTLPRGKSGDFETELLPEFLRAFSQHGGITLHLVIEAGDNLHHILEAVFKALARALREAVSLTGEAGVPSTKGALD